MIVCHQFFFLDHLKCSEDKIKMNWSIVILFGLISIALEVQAQAQDPAKPEGENQEQHCGFQLRSCKLNGAPVLKGRGQNGPRNIRPKLVWKTIDKFIRQIFRIQIFVPLNIF